MKLTAVAIVAVLALTGFTSAKGKSKSRSSGGGCSSSSQLHDGSRS